MIQFAERLTCGADLIWMGHSLGGQLVGLIPTADSANLSRVVTIASGSGYYPAGRLNIIRRSA